MNKFFASIFLLAIFEAVVANAPLKVQETSLPPPVSCQNVSAHLQESVSSVTVRRKRECSMQDLNRLKVKISVALERQIEKMMKDDYVDNHIESASCTHYRGLSMNYPIRLFIRTTVENAVSDYKLELLRP